MCLLVQISLGYKCVCFLFWYGDFCEFNNVCVLDLCKNFGICVNVFNDYKCKCVKGFMGWNCQYCDLCYWGGKLCVNGGNCIVNINVCNCL